MQGHPRKVLMVVNALQPGGAETQLMHLAEGLAEAGHQITICCMNKAFVPTESVRAAGVQIVELGAAHKIERLLAVPKLARLARRFEVVHCTIWDASLWGRIAAILARRPVVVADHSTDRSIHTSSKGASRESWVALHNRLLDPFTYATVACAASQRPVLLSEGVDPNKIVYIPNGLPIAAMRSTAASAPGRDAVGLPDGVPLVIQVGVFREEKNQVGALEAVAGIRAAGLDAHLVFIGDGPTKEAVERRAGELDAGEWAHFLGRRSDVPALLPLADVLVQPSLADAMPLTVMEAMAIGVPVVATKVGDVPSMLEGRAGLVVPPGDQAALEAALTELLGDPARRAELGAAGEEIASGQDSATMIRSYEDLFDSAVAA
ncbi:MAG TPA: glycosyltransferase [Solirubrobacterales bacterium]|nr:glycosyltransferase [Solirubrobacterales bacterium]